MVHDRWCGMANALHKEQLLLEIKEQMKNGVELLPEDQYILEINVGNINNYSGDKHEYWILAELPEWQRYLRRKHKGLDRHLCRPANTTS